MHNSFAKLFAHNFEMLRAGTSRPDPIVVARFEALCRDRGQEPILISGVTGQGLRDLVLQLGRVLREAPRP